MNQSESGIQRMLGAEGANWISFSGHSSQGVRDQNQDAFIVKSPLSSDELTYKGILGCIADGVSCSEQGQRASHTAVTQFVSDYYSTPVSWSVKHAVMKILKPLNYWLFSQGKPHLQHNGMITTFSAIIFKSNTAHLFHVGDSRIYRYRDQQLTLLTRDHQRIGIGTNGVLTRALGMDEHLEIDYQSCLLQAGDRFVLTTDGVHEFIPDEQLQPLLCQSLPITCLSEQICQAALERGSSDNTSCIAFEILNLSKYDLLEHQQILLARNIPPALSEGHVIDHFQVLKVLYEGSRSHLYLAMDKIANQKRVIKVPSLNAQDERATLQRFANEYWIASQLQNPRIMKMYPCPATSDYLYQICEYIEGVTLRQWMLDNPCPSLRTVREILKEVIAALRVLQRADMVHRDLKPENIMLMHGNLVKIIDFGTVEVKGALEALPEVNQALPLGSVNYTAPEYINTGQATIYSDLFSVAVIGYEMLCGNLPFKSSSQQNIQHARQIKWAYRPIQQSRSDIPLWVDLAFAKATSPQPNQRYSALGDFITDIYSPNMALSKRTENRPLLKRNPLLFWKCLALFASVLSVIEGLLLLSQRIQ
ncbi:protein kinase domain-containing protein [Agarivorans sp. QJM3NY_33]|uniref:protein kinase domain-containing protein n=1 Tax=Agarivorans sp. QJM3NY_33 TaxID=3421432 RepID=UPI003D7E9A6D